MAINVRKMTGKKGLVGESITNILLWIIFLILAGGIVWYIVKRLTA